MRQITLVMAAFSITALSACRDAKSPRDTTYDNPVGTHMASAVAVAGTGEGGVSVTPKAIAGGYFVAEIKVRIRNAMPNTTYIVQRSPEIGRASSDNGVCERALGLSPWSSADSPAPAFISFVPPAETTPVTVATNSNGDGLANFEFQAATIPTGTKFDVMFRLLNDAVAPTAIILSNCFTVAVL
ncbi:MAG: hypothetical protein ACR2GK_11720 [Gemmatimonadaceae bacterium]